MMERERGVLLPLLDLGRIGGPALTKYNAHRALDDKPPAVRLCDVWGPYGVLVRGDRVWVVNTEGVGAEVTDGSPFLLDLYPEFDGGARSIAPEMEARLDKQEVLARAQADKTVDLADHIRIFGSRLESNFWTWHRIATAEETVDA